MSIRVISWVFGDGGATNPADQSVLVAIADHCRDDGTGAYPSIQTLARKTRLSERTVSRGVARLMVSGLLKVERGLSKHGTNAYTVPMPNTINKTTVSGRPRQAVTPDSVSPSTCQAVTAPLPQSHPTPDAVSPDPYRTVHEPSLSQEERDRLTAIAATVENLKVVWNETTTAPIRRWKDTPATRRRHAEARLRDRGLESMRAVFVLINASPFCRGDNPRGWCAGIDWALRPDTIAKVIEGNYTSARGRPRAGRTGAPLAGKYAGLDEHDPGPVERAS